MATTNFEKFREKLEQSKTKKFASTSNITWMKLDAGKRYDMRFLPLKSENLELPIAIYHYHSITFPDGHYESIACPKKSEDRDCPFCALANQMYRKFTKTENVEYKEAFKKLVAKTHYLLVGFEPSKIDAADIKLEDIKVVKASSKANMDLIESKLAKEVDFIDFKTGRNIELAKTKGVKGGFDTIVFDFADPSVAIAGPNGKAIWDELVEKSPDLSSVVKPMDDEKLAAKFKEYSSAPVATDEDEDESEREVLAPAKPINMAKAVVKPTINAEETEAPFDLDEIRSVLED